MLVSSTTTIIILTVPMAAAIMTLAISDHITPIRTAAAVDSILAEAEIAAVAAAPIKAGCGKNRASLAGKRPA